MSIILLRNSIINGIQEAFKIKLKDKLDPKDHTSITESGFEANYTSFASQEAQQLNHYIKNIDPNGPMIYLFAPHGKWSVVIIPKIKAQWLNRCQHVTINKSVMNVIPGMYKRDGFYPYMSDTEVSVRIRHGNGHGHGLGPGVIMVPHQIYRIYNVTPSEHIPSVSFKGDVLQCVDPCTYSLVSINRQGIYINRKYRHKIDMQLEPKHEGPSTVVTEYDLSIYYRGDLIGAWKLSPDCEAEK